MQPSSSERSQGRRRHRAPPNLLADDSPFSEDSIWEVEVGRGRPGGRLRRWQGGNQAETGAQLSHEAWSAPQPAPTATEGAPCCRDQGGGPSSGHVRGARRALGGRTGGRPGVSASRESGHVSSHRSGHSSDLGDRTWKQVKGLVAVPVLPRAGPIPTVPVLREIRPHLAGAPGPQAPGDLIPPGMDPS